MKRFLFILLLLSWTVSAAEAESLPTSLVGEWKRQLKEDGDSGGFYLLADGRGAWTDGETRQAGTASYNLATRMVTLVTREKSAPTCTFNFVYNPNNKTLTVVKVRIDKGDAVKMSGKVAYVRRSTRVSQDVLNLFGKPKA